MVITIVDSIPFSLLFYIRVYFTKHVCLVCVFGLRFVCLYSSFCVTLLCRSGGEFSGISLFRKIHDRS